MSGLHVKHSPGEDCVSVIDDEGQDVAILVYSDDSERAQLERYAHQFAAAPALVAALVDLQNHPNIRCWCLNPTGDDRHEVPCEQARAALALARGEVSR